MDNPIGSTIAQRDPRFPHARHVAFQVAGDSMELDRISDGDTIVCVDWEDAGLAPITTMVVVVETRKFEGQAYELCLRQVVVRSDEIRLIPRSRNSAHQELSISRNDPSPDTRIIAVVVEIRRPVRF